MAIFGFMHLHILSLTWSQQRDDSHSLPMLSEQREPRGVGGGFQSRVHDVNDVIKGLNHSLGGNSISGLG
jgi:hypothetical protein